MSLYCPVTDTGAEEKHPLWVLFLIKPLQKRLQCVFNVREKRATLFIASLGIVKLREATVKLGHRAMKTPIIILLRPSDYNPRTNVITSRTIIIKQNGG